MFYIIYSGYYFQSPQYSDNNIISLLYLAHDIVIQKVCGSIKHASFGLAYYLILLYILFLPYHTVKNIKCSSLQIYSRILYLTSVYICWV